MKHSRAFTLLELLVVLGLIVLIFSIGFPSVHRMFVHGELKAGVRQLQGELYRTRLEAMKSGKPFVFRCEFGTANFEVVPKSIFDNLQQNQTGLGAVAVGPELLETGTNSGFDDPFTTESSAPNQPTVSTSCGDLYRKTLNGSVVFGFPLGVGAPGWSPPIFFYPNGRTSETTFVLRTVGQYDFRQELRLRGLTGTASVEGQ